MKTFLTRVQGFTPVIDALAQELSTLHALVYGVVWRFCQMKDGVCTASAETMAQMVGITRMTLWRKLKDLCEQGYLRDLTPNRRNAPHRYQDTGKAKILGLVEGKVEGEETVSERYSSAKPEDATVSQRDSGVSERYSLPETVSQSYTNCITELHEESIKKEVLKKESKIDARAEVIRLFKYTNRGTFPKGTQQGIESLFESFSEDDVLRVAREMGHSFGFTVQDMRTVLEKQQTRGP